RALAHDPSRRPRAIELADSLRGAAAPRRHRRGRALGVSVPVDAGRAVAAALAAAFAGWTAAALPFYPRGWAVGLALVAAAAAAWRPRLGLAVALAVPVLPLGNISLGLAILYAALAAGWLVLCCRE